MSSLKKTDETSFIAGSLGEPALIIMAREWDRMKRPSASASASANKIERGRLICIEWCRGVLVNYYYKA